MAKSRSRASAGKGKDLSKTAGQVEKDSASQTGLSPEQQAMEDRRAERGSAVRGTGDMPTPEHGQTRPVETSNQAAAPLTRANVDDELDIDERPKRSIMVRARKIGYYDDKRRRTGDTFAIRPPYVLKGQGPIDEDTKEATDLKVDEFSEAWMEKVDGSTRERTTSARAAGVGDGRGKAKAPTGERSVLG